MKVYYCFPEGKCKALTMSYDDGMDADRRLVSVFNKNGIKGTFNLNYCHMSGNYPKVIPAEEICELYRGHEIATHTLNHYTIGRCPMTLVAEEILEDRKGLEALTGRLIRGHAYPNGSYSKEIESLFSELGIAYGRITSPSHNYKLPSNPMEWQPTCKHTDPDLMKHGRYLAESKRRHVLDLLYVWGHSYEFDNDNNWNVIEEFCELVGNKDDIWYATNIEIIDYMEVLNRLQFTADNKGVFNPSAASAWLDVNDGTIIEVKGGSFVTL